MKCKVCSSEFIAPANNPHKMYCGNACKVAAFKRVKDPLFGTRMESRRLAKEQRAIALANQKSRTQDRRIEAQRQASCRACAHCGVEYCVTGWWTMRMCGPECAKASAREQKKAARLARKAIERAATVESVVPLKVFRRDGWRCYLCGCATPESLRGTYEGNAPELEHMTPLSRGGDHSYANVRCACRSCNLIKGDRTVEEVGGAHQMGAGGSQDF